MAKKRATAKRVMTRELNDPGPLMRPVGPPWSDLYHKLLTVPWQALIGLLAGGFVVANLIFAAGYYFGGGIEGANPDSFADAFFFSVQTIATIGYGKMAPVSMLAHILVSLEAFAGLMGLAMVTGLVFAKFSRPTARIRFSRNAVIVARDGVPSLIFRMANLRGNRIVEAQVHVSFSRQETTLEGEEVRRFYDLAMARDRSTFFPLTWTVIHPIVKDSPLLGAAAESLAADGTLIAVSVVGLDETISQTVHARHSYRAEDIVWGMRFADIVDNEPDGSFSIDYDRFDDLSQQ
ncbi:MAG TPA: ion channel [Candidatus Binataceae bacterium]|nr:ion channel [Candidatus Binataceae bacterium]